MMTEIPKLKWGKPPALLTAQKTQPPIVNHDVINPKITMNEMP